MNELIRNFIADKSAASAMEYALLGVFIAIIIITGMSYVGTQLNQYYSSVANDI